MTGPRSPEVVAMCGVAGSGKTTHARRLETEGYVRLSIDEEVWAHFGRHGIDYPAEEYARLSGLAEEAVRHQLMELLAAGRDVVLDLSFWSRAERERYQRLVEDAGGRWRLVFLDVPVEELRRRLRARPVDANGAFPITDDLLAAYLAGFERPDGEGADVLPD